MQAALHLLGDVLRDTAAHSTGSGGSRSGGGDGGALAGRKTLSFPQLDFGFDVPVTTEGRSGADSIGSSGIGSSGSSGGGERVFVCTRRCVRAPSA
jgi:hypothetical protein